jgi:hypothetical protein
MAPRNKRQRTPKSNSPKRKQKQTVSVIKPPAGVEWQPDWDQSSVIAVKQLGSNNYTYVIKIGE